MRISEVAKKAEDGVETMRFYEREGLIDQPPKAAGGWVSELCAGGVRLIIDRLSAIRPALENLICACPGELVATGCSAALILDALEPDGAESPLTPKAKETKPSPKTINRNF